MKKIIAMLLVLVLALSMAACGAPKAPAAAAPAAPAAPVAEAPAAPVPASADTWYNFPFRTFLTRFIEIRGRTFLWGPKF